MRDLALSATSTTGLFTLLGAVVGAIIGGTLTILIEVLRRRWQRQDAREQSADQKRTAAIDERKTLYPELLTKCSDIDYYRMTALLAKNPKYIMADDVDPSKADLDEIAKAFAEMWPIISPAIRELQSIKSKVELIAGKEVRQRLDAWVSRMVEDLAWASTGMRKKRNEDKGPYDLLLDAMQAELRNLAIDSGEKQH